MKKIFSTLLFALMMLPTFAVVPQYVGDRAEFYAYRFDGEYYLILAFDNSENNRLVGNTIVKFKMMDGSVMKFEGYDSGREIMSRAYHIVFGPPAGSPDSKHYAVFKITPEQIEQLKVGVDRVAINTLPNVFKKRKWSEKASFGIRLYNSFKGLTDDFED